MAGIVGIAKSHEWRLVTRSLTKLRHRGDRVHAMVEEDKATLGESHGAPMGMWLGRSLSCKAVCDGAIYNWRHLDEEALDVDQALQSLFERQGSTFVKDLDGPFALAIACSDGLFIARDTLGVCPLYYGISDGSVCFASEVKALLGWATEIREFPPGHYYHPREGITRYDEFSVRPHGKINPEDGAAELRSRLSEAVAKCIHLSGEVGSWLSGGIDSSATATLVNAHSGKVDTFAVGVPGSPDLEYARAVAQHIHSRHHELTVTADDMLRALPEVIYHLESFDALLVRSSITNYLAGRIASDHVAAVLSGEGGDELFAGYEYLKQIDPSKLPDELVDITNRLHNTALQRVDRCSSAHGLLAHTPFLARRVRDYAAVIPVDCKLNRNGDAVEKWILRRAMDGMLPPSVVDRPKAKFWEGAGVVDLVKQHADGVISDQDFARERRLPDGGMLNSKEELFYYRLFREHFGDLDNLSFVGRTKGAPVE